MDGLPEDRDQGGSLQPGGEAADELREVAYGDLTQRRQGPELPLPISNETNLPLEKLDPEMLERLAAEMIARQENEGAHFYGRRGQAQHGLDVVEFEAGGSCSVYQVRRYNTMKPQDITDAVAEYVGPAPLENGPEKRGKPHRWFDARRYVLFTSAEFNNDVTLVDRLHQLRRQYGEDLVIEVWGREKISHMLRDRGPLVYGIFGWVWASSYCGYSSPPPAFSGPVQVHSFAPARSRYLSQVEAIAPLELQDREAEMRELADFCLGEEGDCYAWWQADEWAGKSALLSTFVLGVASEDAAQPFTIVPFFITPPYDTREDFIDVVVRQLTAILGKRPPSKPSEDDLLELLPKAAAKCRDRAGRLVVVVDGLDEERDVSLGRDARSIAGLLPAAPPAGMRVIVASRRNHRVPRDVPGDHPLRDERIIRQLEDSESARNMRDLSEKELWSLLRGGEAGRTVLGLLTAAEGWLSADDLAGLSEIPLWEIEQILDTVTGRSFRRRPDLSDPENRPPVYHLGHSELQKTAGRHLTSTRQLKDRFDGHYAKLHSWADDWLARGWPTDSPEYLLTGYFRLLDRLGDLPRMKVLAGNRARHDRMLDLTGGDAAALAEIRTALRHIAAQKEPEDLASALALACHRDHLIDRNSGIPTGLPSVWARLGRAPRAEAVAQSITDSALRASALARNAVALAQTGRRQDAKDAARLSVNVASSGETSSEQASMLAHVAATLTLAGQQLHAREAAEQALAAIGPDTSRSARDEPLSWAAMALARTGQFRQAEDAAKSINNPKMQASALARIAGTLAQAGRHEDAKAVAQSIADPAARACPMAQVSLVLLQARQYDQAQGAAEQAVIDAQSIPDGQSEFERWAAVLAQAAAGLARVRQSQPPEAIAQLIAHCIEQAIALAQVGEQLAQIGHHHLHMDLSGLFVPTERSMFYGSAMQIALAQAAVALAITGEVQQAMNLARSLTSQYWREEALAGVTAALAIAGKYQQAIDAAGTITVEDLQQDALGRVALVASKAGDYQQAADAARSIPNQEYKNEILLAVALDASKAGDYRQATEATQSVTDQDLQRRLLTRLSEQQAQTGPRQQDEDTTAQAEAPDPMAITPSWSQASALATAARHHWAIAKRGLTTEAAKASSFVYDSFAPHYAGVLAEAAMALARAGQDEDASVAARMAMFIALSITGARSRSSALAHAAEALTHTGQDQDADRAARLAADAAWSIIDPYPQASALAEVAIALAQAGEHQDATISAQQAEAIAAQAEPDIEAEMEAAVIPDPKMRALAKITMALALVGQDDRARATAQQAEAAAKGFTISQEERDYYLVQAAVALAWSGQPEEAGDILRLVNESKARTCGLAEVALALAQAGRHEEARGLAVRAEDIARSIDDPENKARVHALVALALAQVGEQQRAQAAAQQAESTAQSITNPYWQAIVLAQAALALAKIAPPLPQGERHGQPQPIIQHAQATAQRAQAIVQSITRPEAQAHVLAQVAEAMAQAGHVSARHVTAEACATGRWTDAIKPVFLLEPSAYATLADALRERQ